MAKPDFGGLPVPKRRGAGNCFGGGTPAPPESGRMYDCYEDCPDYSGAVGYTHIYPVALLPSIRYKSELATISLTDLVIIGGWDDLDVWNGDEYLTYSATDGSVLSNFFSTPLPEPADYPPGTPDYSLPRYQVRSRDAGHVFIFETYGDVQSGNHFVLDTDTGILTPLSSTNWSSFPGGAGVTNALYYYLPADNKVIVLSGTNAWVYDVGADSWDTAVFDSTNSSESSVYDLDPTSGNIRQVHQDGAIYDNVRNKVIKFWTYTYSGTTYYGYSYDFQNLSGGYEDPLAKLNTIAPVDFQSSMLALMEDAEYSDPNSSVNPVYFGSAMLGGIGDLTEEVVGYSLLQDEFWTDEKEHFYSITNYCQVGPVSVVYNPTFNEETSSGRIATWPDYIDENQNADAIIIAYFVCPYYMPDATSYLMAFVTPFRMGFWVF